MEKVKEIAAGKAKSMFTTNNPNELIMEFRDDASAFDGKKRASLAGKGAVNNQFNAFIMDFSLSGTTTCFSMLQPILVSLFPNQFAFVFMVLPDNNSLPIDKIETFIDKSIKGFVLLGLLKLVAGWINK